MTLDELNREEQRAQKQQALLFAEIRRLRTVCALAAADLVRECRDKNVDTMWHGPGCTLWDLLNMNGAELDEPYASREIR